MAQCGKCGRDLPNIGTLAFDAGHYCQPLLPGARQVIILCRQTGDFDVCVDGLFADRLSWGEMLEAVIGLTHPTIRKTQYHMRTPQQMAAQNKKYGEGSEEVEIMDGLQKVEPVIDGEYAEVEEAKPVEPSVPFQESNILTDEDIPF